MEEEKKTNKRIVFSIIAVLLLVVIVAGTTYAYFSATASTNTQTVTTAKLELSFNDGTAIVNASNIIPITTDEVLTKGTKKTFTIGKSATSSDMYAKIKLTDITIPTELAKYDLKWALYQDTNKIATGDFGGKTSGEIVIATNQFINSTTGLTYDLYLWINETGLDQNVMQGKTLTAKVTATASATKENTLANAILTNGVKGVSSREYEYIGCPADCVASVGEETCYHNGACEGRNLISATYSDIDKTIYDVPTFTSSSTDRGLYVQQGDTTKSEMGFPTYYYRGDIVGNYVKFGKYKTTDGGNTVGNDILWRIVRINEDGSIRLISENNITTNTITWNSTRIANYINTDGTDSEIKQTVETWYTNNIGNDSTLDKRVVTSSFCSDTSGNYRAAYTRLGTNKSPIYTCPSGAITAYSKVGLLTADELVFGGGLIWETVSNNTTYLDNGTDFWTSTPAPSPSAFFWNSRSAYVLDNYVDSVAGSRAVINLSSDVTVTTGDGLSADTAYVIK